MLDNESQTALKSKTTGMGFICQLFPPRLILENNIEQEIYTFNDYFVLVMCIYDTNCNLKLWCHVLPQATHKPKYDMFFNTPPPIILPFTHRILV